MTIASCRPPLRASAVVEVYAKWCGPSPACKSTYRKLQDDLIDQQKRIRLCQVCATDVKGVEELVKYAVSARPTFLLYLNGEKVGTVEGVSTPTLEKLIKAYLPVELLGAEAAEEGEAEV